MTVAMDGMHLDSRIAFARYRFQITELSLRCRAEDCPVSWLGSSLRHNDHLSCALMASRTTRDVEQPKARHWSRTFQREVRETDSLDAPLRVLSSRRSKDPDRLSDAQQHSTKLPCTE